MGIFPYNQGMRRWNLTYRHPFRLNLAADERFGGTDYSNDQIWELSLGEGEPPAVSLRTTFGLRARGLRLFPCFSSGDYEVCDPEEFARAPVVRNFYPNFVRLDFSPFPDIDVLAEYWVPQSHAILGRFWMRNHTASDQVVQLEWAAVLSTSDGQRMAADQIDGTSVLSGLTGDLAPVVFMTGGAQPGKSPYPALVRELLIPSGGEVCAAWSHTACVSAVESLELARELNALPWEAHTARIEMLNAGHVEIYTGSADWDMAFALSQCLCHSMFVGPSEHLPEPSFVSSRQPDHGYSLRGDGSDYSHLWNGQTPLDTYHLSNLLLPGSPDLLVGVLRNYFAIQKEDGFVDLKPGLGGQFSRAMATPLLATIAWRVYLSLSEYDPAAREFLTEAYPALLRYIDHWFAPEFDEDQDGLPEWTHPMQTGLEDHPLFSAWQPWSQGADIRTSESPALAAMLYRECRALQQMAVVLGETGDLDRLSITAERLKSRIADMWDENSSSYQYRDRDSHLTTEAKLIAEQTGPGTMSLQYRSDSPVRLMLKVKANGETRPQPVIFIHGENASGQHRIERIEADQIRWSLDYGVLTGDRVYISVEKVELQGFLPQDEISLSTVGYLCQDITLLLPLWAGIPASEQSDELVNRQVIVEDKFWRQFGLPACIGEPAGDHTICSSVNLTLNSMVAEGLLAYGQRSSAAELVSRLMAGIIQNIRQDGVLRRSFNSDSGDGIGERNALGGLAPVSLFLDVLGVHLVSQDAVYISGFNPYPWPITVKYRGTTILRQKDKTSVIFPDGQTVEITEDQPQLVRLQG